MKLKWKWFSDVYKLMRFIKENNIKREDIQQICLRSSDSYELFYWEIWGDYMSWIDTRSDIDKEISSCYSQIEELQNRIKELEAKKKSESRIDDLVKQLNENRDD